MSTPEGLQRVIVKVGASVLTDQAGRVLPQRLAHIAGQIAAAASGGRQVILVSSGAIACGMAALGLAHRPHGIAQLQACAAVGQSELMRRYAEAFGRHRLRVAQVLLTQEDLAETARHRNAKQTLLTLLHRRVIPIVNENDTVAVEEITFGDNDRLAALLAAAVDGQLLVLLTDVEGLMKDGTLVERVEGIEASHRGAVRRRHRDTTKGGMGSKLAAAQIAGHDGIPTVVANGARERVLEDLLAGKAVGTLFVPPARRLTPKQWRIAFSLREPNGRLVVDAGAARALTHDGKSLLASGLERVEGRFAAGAFIVILDGSGTEVARGVANFSSQELARIRGLRTDAASRALGGVKVGAIVHRDHLVLSQEID